MPNDLDLDALEKRIGGWCRDSVFYVCPDNPHRIRTNHESWPESPVADVHFDDLAEHLVEYLTAAPALIARCRDADRDRQAAIRAEERLDAQCAYSITLQRLIETLARGKMPASDDVNAPHLSRKANEVGLRMAALEAGLRDALTALDATECTEDHDASGRPCPKACITRLRSLLTPTDGADDAG